MADDALLPRDIAALTPADACRIWHLMKGTAPAARSFQRQLDDVIIASTGDRVLRENEIRDLEFELTNRILGLSAE